MPSDRLVSQIGISEAEMVRELFRRIADGSSLTEEARRLSALGIPAPKRYGTGKTLVLADSWSVRRLAGMIHNPTYKGTALLESRRGTVEWSVPALVDEATWNAAQMTLTRNRRLSKRSAKRVYPLRGLIRCDNCDSSYIGSAVTGLSTGEWRHYRCDGQTVADRTARCRSKSIGADWIEGLVWEDCKAYIFDPGSYLADAPRQLRERLAESATAEERRRALLREIGQKESERERVLTMYRRGKISMDEADTQLDDIARETATLRGLVESLRAQEALTAAAEAYLTDTAAALARLQDRVEEIERTNDLAGKRKVFEILVQRIGVQTEGAGRRKQATVSLQYAYQPQKRFGAVLPTAWSR